LLKRFGTPKNHQEAERTGRACLLLPASDDELKQAIALIDLALAAEPPNPPWITPYLRFAKALAEYRVGRMKNALELLQGDTLNILLPAPRILLAMVQHNLGQTAAARKTLEAAIGPFDWDPAKATNREAWMYHILRREAEDLILPKMPAFLNGKYEPKDNDERLAFVGACQFLGRHRSLARQAAAADNAERTSWRKEGQAAEVARPWRVFFAIELIVARRRDLVPDRPSVGVSLCQADD
jgi:hypothetical protein